MHAKFRETLIVLNMDPRLLNISPPPKKAAAPLWQNHCLVSVLVWNHRRLHQFHGTDDELWQCWETKSRSERGIEPIRCSLSQNIKRKILLVKAAESLIMKTVKPFVPTLSCVCIINPLSGSILICPSQTNSLFMDPFFFARECKHHELIPNISKSFCGHNIRRTMFIFVEVSWPRS